MNNFLVITGGMGTGKSTVLNLFEQNGFFVINSDKEVVYLFSSNYEKYHQIATDFDNWLGTDFSTKTEIDKKKLRNLLENTPNGFPKSLQIVKPYIIERLNQLAELHKEKQIVFEIPLLFEAKMEKNYSNILVITANLDIRLSRIKERQPHLSLEQIKQTIDSQFSDDIKLQKCNFHIENNGTLDDLKQSFNSLIPQILSIYSKKTSIKNHKIK